MTNSLSVVVKVFLNTLIFLLKNVSSFCNAMQRLLACFFSNKIYKKKKKTTPKNKTKQNKTKQKKQKKTMYLPYFKIEILTPR